MAATRSTTGNSKPRIFPSTSETGTAAKSSTKKASAAAASAEPKKKKVAAAAAATKKKVSANTSKPRAPATAASKKKAAAPAAAPTRVTKPRAQTAAQKRKASAAAKEKLEAALEKEASSEHGSEPVDGDGDAAEKEQSASLSVVGHDEVMSQNEGEKEVEEPKETVAEDQVEQDESEASDSGKAKKVGRLPTHYPLLGGFLLTKLPIRSSPPLLPRKGDPREVNPSASVSAVSR
ncbi:MAG: hypothetical protein M1829_006607 [Trizodia sp. TS-e1964]|nr:MAG: hypothetical protein M1829_006607 [Trizodia sp. TS-e1964]